MRIFAENIKIIIKMEEKLLHKVYSNNSKKRRLKRDKRHIRVWNRELQKYVKVKKEKKRITMTDAEMKKYFEHTPEELASVKKPSHLKEEMLEKLPGVKKMKEKKQKPQTPNFNIPDNEVTETLTGRKLTWDQKAKRYVFKAA